MKFDYYNISFLCAYFASSRSKWEKFAIGSPIDHSRNADRFSFHTENETTPFFQVDLPAPAHVAYINIILRNQYTDKELPFLIEGLKPSEVTGDDEWFSISKITGLDQSENTIPIDKNITSIRVTKLDRGQLYFSSINIFVARQEFLRVADAIPHTSGTVLTHAPWYGLGGGLAVCASSAGAVQETRNKKFLASVPFSDLIDFPANLFENNTASKYVKKNVNPTIAADVFKIKPEPKSDKNTTMWTFADYPMHQTYPCIGLTRDHDQQYSFKDEHPIATSQRLYGRIIPSSKVLDRLQLLLDKFDLTTKKFKTALGIHVRHGNGERYYSKRRKMWGVKPPSRTKIRNAIEKAIEVEGIDRIVVCSDSPVLKEFITEQFPMLDVIFISETIQKTGAGCNHLPHVFDTEVKRTEIDRKEDDINTFAEMLVLSHCERLCGGSSYFFNAATGFSSIDPKHIYPLDNTDRYARIPDDARAIADIEDGLGAQLLSILRENSTYVDGLFLTQEGDNYTFSFYDKTLKSGSASSISSYINSKKFLNQIIEDRLY